MASNTLRNGSASHTEIPKGPRAFEDGNCIPPQITKIVPCSKNETPQRLPKHVEYDIALFELLAGAVMLLLEDNMMLRNDFVHNMFGHPKPHWLEHWELTFAFCHGGSQGGPFQEMGRQNLESADILLIGYSGLQQLKIQVCILIAARWCMNLRSCSAIVAPPCLERIANCVRL